MERESEKHTGVEEEEEERGKEDQHRDRRRVFF